MVELRWIQKSSLFSFADDQFPRRRLCRQLSQQVDNQRLTFFCWRCVHPRRGRWRCCAICSAQTERRDAIGVLGQHLTDALLTCKENPIDYKHRPQIVDENVGLFYDGVVDFGNICSFWKRFILLNNKFIKKFKWIFILPTREIVAVRLPAMGMTAPSTRSRSWYNRRLTKWLRKTSRRNSLSITNGSAVSCGHKLKKAESLGTKNV